MRKFSDKVLFIEGTREDKNGNLRLGFENLLKQKLLDKMPRIKMGEDNQETVRKYKNAAGPGTQHALIDLDGKGVNATQGNYPLLKSSKRAELKLNNDDSVYFMVQKMEAWFLSQPEVLTEHFKIKIGKIPYDHPSKNEEPDTILKTLTKSSHRPYHKVKDGSILLEKLNLSKLEDTFDDLKELIKKLKA